MKKLIRFTSILFTLVTIVSCSSTTYQAARQVKTVVADGNPDEWSLPLRYSDSKSGLQYNITNDETNLYVCIRATEQPIQMKILSSGMYIWLDPSGKNKETLGIQFPLLVKHDRKPMAENKQSDMSKGMNQGRMNMVEEFHLQEPQITLSGFLPEYNGTFIAAEAKGIKAAIDWNEQNFMTYELVIPLNSFTSKDLNSLMDNSVIGFKINVNAIAGMRNSSNGGGKPGGGPGGAGQGAGGGGGGQGGMKGGSGGGPGGGGGGEMGESSRSPEGQASEEMSSSISIKFKVKLNDLVKK